MITHLWELGTASMEENSRFGYRIEILGVDWEKRDFRKSIEGDDINEVKLKAFDFILNHYRPILPFIPKQPL